MIGRRRMRFFTTDELGYLVVVLALQAFTYGIAASLREADSQSFFWVCLIAALIGFGSNKGGLNGIQASVGIAALGVLGVWVFGARLASPLLDLARAVLSVLPQIVPAVRFGTGIDTSAILEAWEVIVNFSSALLARSQTWLIGVQGNVRVNDALIRNMVWVLILWLVAAWTGWFSARRNAVAALMPPMLLLAAVASYSEYRVESLWMMVVLLLLLMGIWNYRTHTQQWQKQRVDYSDSIRYDSAQAVLFLTIAIGAVALITPSISWRQIREYLRERSSKNEVAEMLGVQEEPRAVQPAVTPKPSLPREHLLTEGYAHSQKIVMTIRTGELPSSGNPFVTVDAPRYYWRGVVYDRYVGAGWVTGPAPPQGIPADTPLIPGLLEGYKPLHLDVDLIQPEGRLFWSGMLFSADVPLTVEWRLRPPSSLFADQPALLQADMFHAVSDATSYRAESFVPNVTIEALRLASTEYPEEIAERYLEIPASVPERVGGLALEITRGQTNPYDRAKAIETYLRENYAYDLEIPAPPTDRDVADYFLFELKRGYCDYYATAMVVLARLNGIPARFVSGYSPGTYDSLSARYIVRELNAHSWAEVYFPEIGWIEFEPTASLPEIERAATEASLPAVQADDPTASNLLTRFRVERISVWGLPLLGAFLLIVLYYTFIERWVYLRLAPALAIERIYRRLYRLGRPLAGERTRAETVHEFMSKLNAAFDGFKTGPLRRRMFALAQRDVRLLTNTYHAALFRQTQLNRNEIKLALQTWRHLRLRLLYGRLILSLKNR